MRGPARPNLSRPGEIDGCAVAAALHGRISTRIDASKASPPEPRTGRRKPCTCGRQGLSTRHDRRVPGRFMLAVRTRPRSERAMPNAAANGEKSRLYAELEDRLL